MYVGWDMYFRNSITFPIFKYCRNISRDPLVATGPPEITRLVKMRSGGHKLFRITCEVNEIFHDFLLYSWIILRIKTKFLSAFYEKKRFFCYFTAQNDNNIWTKLGLQTAIYSSRGEEK